MIPHNLAHPFECISHITDSLNADVLLYSADIDYENVDIFIEKVRQVEKRHENVALILCTYGGDPDAAYRMTRILKDKYKKFTLFVFGYCKSAGTLIALGANEIVMSDFAELGPLDVQVYRDDDFRRTSGLDLQQALNVISTQVFDIFEHCLLGTIQGGGGVITTKTAADIASSMAVGLLAPISSQIDPLRLGEMNRLMSVGYEYGRRLNPERLDSIRRLVSGYPSHSFVIDYEEAQLLFENVRRPTEDELLLEKIFFRAIRSSGTTSLVTNLTELAETQITEDTLQEGKLNNESTIDDENITSNDNGNTSKRSQGDGGQDGELEGIS